MTPMKPTREPQVTRRGVLAAGAAALVGAPVVASALTACTDSSGGSGGPAGGTTTGPVTLSASDVPVGGGKILSAQQVVVAQPSAGEFKAFSAVCTHQGCIVANVSGGRINCTCHNS